MTTNQRKYVVFGVVGAIAMALDQWTKALARQILKPMLPNRHVVIDGFWDMRYSENTGIAFGLLQRDTLLNRVMLSVVATVAFVVVLMYLRKTLATQLRIHIALALVGGGAIGNLLDRIMFGRVTDFIVWHYHGKEWPAFNVADAALVVGVILMAFDILPAKKKDKPEGEDAAPAPSSS